MTVKRNYSVLIALLLLVTWLTAHFMGDSLWYDEWRSLFNIGGLEPGTFSPAQILDRIAADNAWQAPTYYLMLSAWGNLVGWTEYADRALSLFFGLLAVCWLYRLGRDAVSLEVGLYAAAVFGLSGFALHLMHEQRTYTLVALLVVVTLDSYWRLVYRRGGWGSALLFVIGVAGLPYAHYFSVTSAFALALYHLIAAPKNRRWWVIPALMLIALALFLPWLSVVLKAVGMAGIDARRFQLLTPPELLGWLMTLFGNNSPGLIALALLAALAWAWRSRSLVFFAFMCVVPLALMHGLDQFVRILVHVKYAFHLIPALALATAIGVGQLAQRGVPPALMGAAWLALCLWSVSNPAYVEIIRPHVWEFPWQEAVRSLDGRARDGDTALVLLPDPSLLTKNYEPIMDYYFQRLPVRSEIIAPSPATPDERYYALADEAIDDAARVWVIYDVDRRPWRAGPVMDSVLPDDGFVACGDAGEMPSVLPARLFLFAHRPDSKAPLVQYDGVSVYDLGISTQGHDGVLPLVIGFESSLPSDTYSFGVHVEDAAGQLVAQHDGGLPTGFTCSAFDLPVTGLPAGEYTLRLVVYQWQTGARLLDATGEERPVLGAFHMP